MSLPPEKTPAVDLYVANIIAPSPKDDMASMVHPLFALRSGIKKISSYQHNGTTVTIKPGPDGCATIHDKDVWIYCISQLIEAQNQGLKIGRCVHFVAYDFLITAGRRTDGRGYEQMVSALKRLKGTTIETNIETAGQRERAGFGLIDSWRVVESENGRMVAVEVILPDWLYRSVKTNQVLTLSKEYFAIRSPLYRRIYEIARKHCGYQIRWPISIKALHKKSNSSDVLRNFRKKIKMLAEKNSLPGYHVVYNSAADTVKFYQRSNKGHMMRVNDIVKEIYRR